MSAVDLTVPHYRTLYKRTAKQWELFAYCECGPTYPGGMGPVTIDQMKDAEDREERYPTRDEIKGTLPLRD